MPLKSVAPKEYREIDFDAVASMEQARINIKEKKCLNDIYCETYDLMVDLGKTYLDLQGKKQLELGSGGGFMGERYPNIITSDIMDTGNVDMVIDAQELPFMEGELEVIYAMHVLHHIPDVVKFLREAERTLCVGGGIVLVEPYWSPFATFVYGNFHPEPFDKTAESWNVRGGAMSGSNQALSYILLKRDKEKFDKMFPDLKVIYEKPFNCMRYMATGGMWLKPKLPEFMFPVLKCVEKCCAPLMYMFGIHHVFVLKKCS